MTDPKVIAKKLQMIATNIKEAADSIHQMSDQNDPNQWVDSDVEKVQKDTDTISLSEKDIPVKKGSKTMVTASNEDRIKIAADLNKIADKMDEVEEKEASGIISSKRANEIKLQIKSALNHVADEVERLGLDESIVDDEGNDFDEENEAEENNGDIEDLM